MAVHFTANWCIHLLRVIKVVGKPGRGCAFASITSV